MATATARTAIASARELDFVLDLSPPTGDFGTDVLEGLSRAQKALPAKYLYDERGSELFDALCATQDYYITRTEMSILRDMAWQAASFAGPNAAILEIGAGATVKIRTLLDALENPEQVIALDISREFLLDACADLASAYPEVRVGAVCADFTDTLDLPNDIFDGSERRLAFFPGSTFGNFEPAMADGILRSVRSLLRPGDGFLIGIDLIKDPAVLEAAYDDSEGVTAEFELNILNRINRELGGDIDHSGFGYRASWNEALSQIDMYLVSLREQSFTVCGRTFHMAKDETIHTESSRKFTVESFAARAAGAGFEAKQVWTDAEQLFSVHLLEAS